AEDIDIYDFYYINKAPRAAEKHSLDNLIKIYFSAKNIAVDIEEHEIYMDALYSRNGIDTFEDTIELNDKEGLINILENMIYKSGKMITLRKTLIVMKMVMVGYYCYNLKMVR